MPERNPREWQIEVCSECGCDPEACVCDECDEIETVPAVEDLGPERMLAWAIDRLGGPDPALPAERLTGYVRLTLPGKEDGIDVEITDDGHPVEITWTEDADDFYGTETRCVVLSESELRTIVAEWAALRGSGDGEAGC